jgi:hypothetical protein
MYESFYRNAEPHKSALRVRFFFFCNFLLLLPLLLDLDLDLAYFCRLTGGAAWYFSDGGDTAGVIAGSDPVCRISKPLPWPRRTCDPLLSFSNEGRTAPAAACSVEPFLFAAGGIGAVELTGGDDSECLGNAVSALFSTATAANGRLAGRGIAGAV